MRRSAFRAQKGRTPDNLFGYLQETASTEERCVSGNLEIWEIAELIRQESTPQDPVPLRTARQRGAAERELLAVRLRNEGAADLAMKIEGCGTPLNLNCACCGARKTVEIACKRRWCPACTYLVMRERLKKYNRAAALMQWPLMVTLTMQNTPDPDCIRAIREHWGRFRRRKLIDTKMKGGVTTVEVTEGEGGWHPHLHIVADCQWLALHVPAPHWTDSVEVKREKYDYARLELCALWSQVVGQKQATVLANRKAPGEALAYALKYAIKGTTMIESKLPIAPLIRVLQKSRMLSAFGSMHGLNLDDEEEEKPRAICTSCMQETSWIPEFIVDGIYRNLHDKRVTGG